MIAYKAFTWPNIFFKKELYVYVYNIYNNISNNINTKPENTYCFCLAIWHQAHHKEPIRQPLLFQCSTTGVHHDGSNDPSHHEQMLYHRATSCFFSIIECDTILQHNNSVMVLLSHSISLNQVVNWVKNVKLTSKRSTFIINYV